MVKGHLQSFNQAICLKLKRCKCVFETRFHSKHSLQCIIAHEGDVNNRIILTHWIKPLVTVHTSHHRKVNKQPVMFIILVNAWFLSRSNNVEHDKATLKMSLGTWNELSSYEYWKYFTKNNTFDALFACHWWNKSFWLTILIHYWHLCVKTAHYGWVRQITTAVPEPRVTSRLDSSFKSWPRLLPIWKVANRAQWDLITSTLFIFIMTQPR